MVIKKILLVSSVTFIAACAAIDSSSPKGERADLIVASQMTDCVGVVPQKCLLVKENASQKEWHYFYSNIEGFNYEPGYEYQLIIDKVPRAIIAADQSSLEYHLVREVSKDKKVSENMPQTIHAKTTWNR